MNTVCFHLIEKGKDHNHVGSNWDLEVICKSAIREHPGQPFKCELADNKPLVKPGDKKGWVIKIIKGGYSFVPIWCPLIKKEA